ncbi:translation initiation factor III [Paractinoplanes rishiriensis]|uniref:translation initiation factor III n=1 Tax=Paractinoplanes rishiriensis TaxID=1050105 RepID=UPI001EF28500|nr:translation initiation factor III [Actinoplanes rishiriensis]
MLVLVLSVLAALWAVAMMTATGRVGYYYFFLYAEYYMGVITLVSLSITIMVGLVATDRLVLSIRQRVLLQSAHRTTGLIAVTALFLHVWTKYAEGTIQLMDIFVPFFASFNRLWVGFGTLSAWIMVLVMWTGIARSKFIGRGRPWMWRGIHAISYLMWPIALMHGLSAGRPAATWVVVSYIVCVLAVLVGLAVRLSVSLNRNKDFSSAAGIGVRPAGSMVPTSSPAMKAPRGGRREPKPEPEVLGPVAAVGAFQPARPAGVQTLPPLEQEAPPPPRPRRGGFDEDGPRRRRPADDEIEFDEPAPRGGGRRFPGEDTSTRMRRPDLEDTSTRMRRPDLEDTSARMRRPDLEDTSTRMRRVEMDDTSTRMRRVEMDDTRTFRPDFDDAAPRQRGRYDDEPAPRSRRRAAEPLPMYDEEPRGRRGEGYDEPPRQRGRYDDEPSGRRARYEPRFGGEAEGAPRGRRDRGAEIDGADSGRHSRTGFLDLADGEFEGDELPTLVDMASRRARRAEQDPVRSQAGRGARRGGRGRSNDDVADDEYWSQLRGEAN